MKKTIDVLKQDPSARLFKEYLTEAKAVEGVGNQFRFTITTNDVDRDNDVIDPKGWSIESYLKNPVVLWAHDYTQPPVAIARTLERTPSGLASVAEFIDPAVYPFAGTIAAMVRMGALNATSVGFRPLPGKWSYNEQRKGVDFAGQELLEYSIVPVPANASCLIEARSAGIDVEPLREWAAKTLERLTEKGEKGTILQAIALKLEGLEGFAEATNRLLVSIDGLKGALAEKKPKPSGSTDDGHVGQSSDEGDGHGEPDGEDADGGEPKPRHDLGKPPKAAKTCPMKGECLAGEGEGGACGMGEDCPMEENKAVEGALKIADLLAKRGRVLSSANEGKLRQAHERIGEVLATVAEQPVVEESKEAPVQAKSYLGFDTCGHTAEAAGASAPTHVHDYSLYVYTRDSGVVVFDGGCAFAVADHSHRITQESLARGETEASDGHIHSLRRAGVKTQDPPATVELDIDLDAIKVASEDGLGELDAAEFVSVMRAAIQSEVKEQAAKAVNAARGRVD